MNKLQYSFLNFLTQTLCRKVWIAKLMWYISTKLHLKRLKRSISKILLKCQIYWTKSYNMLLWFKLNYQNHLYQQLESNLIIWRQHNQSLLNLKYFTDKLNWILNGFRKNKLRIIRIFIFQIKLKSHKKYPTIKRVD